MTPARAFAKLPIIGCLLLPACLPAFAASSGAAAPQPIRDLRYGETLFDFYQDRYFSAITDLLVAKQRAPITRQGDDPELLLGALYLSYGLETDAAGIFNRLLDASSDASVRDRAWFYLGKMHYLDGRDQQAIAAFTRVTTTLLPEQQAERDHLLANAYISQGAYPAAIAVLEQAKGDGVWRMYARYNLAIALLRGGDTDRGMRLLHQIGETVPRSDEAYALRDKANTALGYAALRKGDAAEAAGDFLRVSLGGPYTGKALLGLGWAYDRQQQPQAALSAWTRLADAPSLDDAVQEARLAVPHTLEGLNQSDAALSLYKDIIGGYERQLAELDGALKGLSDRAFIRTLQTASPDSQEDWVHGETFIPGLPGADYLETLLSSREFQQAYRNYRDLLFLRSKARQWEEQIPNLQMMLSTRQTDYDAKLPVIRDRARTGRLEDLGHRRDALAAELKRIADAQDADALADREEHRRLEELSGVIKRLARLRAAGEEVETPARKARILHGMTQWRLETDYPARLWQTEKDLSRLDAALAQAAQSKASLESAWNDAPKGFLGFSDRITRVKAQLDALGGRLDAAIAAQERAIAAMIGAELQRRKDQLTAYRTRAQYALARLNDALVHERSSP